MKRFFKYILVFILAIPIMACSSEGISEITIDDLNNHSKKVVFTDENEVNLIMNAINGAEKQLGVVNMAPAPYRINIGDDSYFLWIYSDESSIGTIMNSKDTNIIYTLSKSSTEKINEILSDSFQMEE